MMSNSRASTKKQFYSSIAPSQLSTSVQPGSFVPGQFRVSNEEFGHRKSSTSQEKPNTFLGNVKIGKRFHEKVDTLSSHEQVKSKFAKIHQRKQTMKDLMEKELKGQRHAQVMMVSI